MNIVFTPTEFEKESLGTYGEGVVVTGMGKMAMLHACYLHKGRLMEDGNEVLLVGFCGLLKGDAKIGDVVIPSVYVDGDYNAYPLEDTIHFIETGLHSSVVCISQDRILTNNPYSDICETFTTAITDMESYAFVEFCRKFRIKHRVIRVVSDKVNPDSAKDFQEACLNGILGKVLEKELK